MRKDIKLLTEKAIELLNDRKAIEDELKKKTKLHVIYRQKIINCQFK